ncbi:hypothetical protein PR003_g6684 [Phytophthora rubi]|uniref:Uncharacterized protein n=1 Tax=Phytophthora rubi TaxID=129364 RepID=A0A6A3NEV2_9STRA|nr:hypothetical protein PR002_g6671 [Phytophthora rubi]KAE9042132.1 hypothetical protein PR001_g6324 [Phytophthora rubi]KAE9347882.1 hypothetical protein PR003_g6684 [Phytophthora rubi]
MATPSRILQQKAAFAAIGGTFLAMCAQASYVEFFQDTNFEHKLTRVNDVQTDVCYDLVCADSNFASTSAKWGGLPETGVAFEGGSAMIAFYTDRNCTSDYKWWPVDSQSDGDLGFPDSFPFNISSFLVINAWEISSVESACSKPLTVDTRTAAIE